MFHCFSRTWAFRKRALWWHMLGVKIWSILFKYCIFIYSVLSDHVPVTEFCSENLCLQYKEHAGLKASFRRQNIWVLASSYIRAEPYTVNFPLLLPPWCKASWAINTGLTVVANRWLFWSRFEFEDPAPLSIHARVWITPSFKNTITLIQYVFDN